MNRENPFNNTEVAFSLKSNRELRKAHFLFKMMGYPSLVNLGSTVMMKSLQWKLPVKSLIRNTVFEHFCGGTTEEECEPVIEKLFGKGVSSILDYSVEGKEDEADFNAIVNKKIKLIKHAAISEALPFEVVKPTGIGRFYIWQKITEKKELTFDEQAEWQRVKDRVQLLSQTAYDNNVALLFDGEESWMQDAADELIRDMMFQFNKEKAIIYNTIQCYRKDRLDYIESLYKDANKNQFVIGAKIVRGAYMEKERDRAQEIGYESPICENKTATDKMFDNVMQFILDKLDRIKLCIGTHNESSTLQAMKTLDEKGVLPNDKSVWFGQLYGMSDNLTYNLAQLNYNTFKILPFGPVKDVMPYLIRRAQENTSVAGQMGRELLLIKEEMKRRKI